MLGVSNALPVISGVTNYSRHQIRVKLSLLLRLEEKLCTFSSSPMIPVLLAGEGCSVIVAGMTKIFHLKLPLKLNKQDLKLLRLTLFSRPRIDRGKSIQSSITIESIGEPVSPVVQGDIYMRISSFSSWGFVLYLIDIARLQVGGFIGLLMLSVVFIQVMGQLHSTPHFPSRALFRAFDRHLTRVSLRDGLFFFTWSSHNEI